MAIQVQVIQGRSNVFRLDDLNTPHICKIANLHQQKKYFKIYYINSCIYIQIAKKKKEDKLKAKEKRKDILI